MAGLYKLDTVDPQLDSACFQPITLEYVDINPGFKMCLSKVNLYRYPMVPRLSVVLSHFRGFKLSEVGGLWR
jgi:hypothetical protein